MKQAWFIVMGGALLLAGCGGGNSSTGSSGAASASSTGTASAGSAASGAQIPAAYLGTWGADCSTPYVKFTEGMLHVYPDNADYAVKAATEASNSLTVSYDTKAGAAVETYEMEGGEMRLTHGTYGGQEATWDKAPMKKCD